MEMEDNIHDWLETTASTALTKWNLTGELQDCLDSE